MHKSISLDDDAKTTRWTHDICRVYCQRTNFASSSSRDLCKRTPAGTSTTFEERIALPTPVCSLCGMGKIHNKGTKSEEEIQEINGKIPGLMRCAAVGCSVWFHPMCAVLSSQLTVHPQNQSPPRKCHNEEMENALRADRNLSKEFTLEKIKVTKKGKTFVVPIGFCGLHNQKREASLYGYSPGAVSPFIKIPNQ